ncbi:MAG: rhodanese-like domain-containing protein, partial [Bacteroidetes bacterium]|nr:rhodanese-like domain-containing protein [Bacteroidota bacterium]
CSQSVLDVRKPGEFLREHVSGAINVPLDNLNGCTASIPKRTIGYLYCASNYRSMIALSVLRARGYDNLVNISGGFKAMKTSREISISSSKPDLE